MIFVGINIAKDKHDCFITNLKKQAEGKRYNVSIFHATKKLVRVMFHLEKTEHPF